MNIEIECKLLLQNPSETEELLKKMGCIDGGEVYERNWVFDKNLELADSLSLLRLRINDDNKWGILTHKSPLAEKQFKRRREIETRVEDADNIRLILESLGYSKSWYYEKKRHSYHYGRNIKIVLDETPELGTYLEIEAESEETIKELLKQLKLNINDNLIISYNEIWKKYCKTHNIAFCDWRF